VGRASAGGVAGAMLVSRRSSQKQGGEQQGWRGAGVPLWRQDIVRGDGREGHCGLAMRLVAHSERCAGIVGKHEIILALLRCCAGVLRLLLSEVSSFF
jgi:hypothetical protein